MSTRPSIHYEGMFDNTAYAAPILTQLRSQHGKQLNQVEVRGDLASAARYENERRRKEAVKRSKGIKSSAASGVDVPPTLLDVLDNGLANPEDASTSVRDLREQLSLVDEYPVLFAIDEVNTLYGQPYSTWSYRDVLPQDMKASKLTLCDAFMPFDAQGLRPGFVPRRGAVIGATTATSYYLPMRMLYKTRRTGKDTQCHWAITRQMSSTQSWPRTQASMIPKAVWGAIASQ